jgi:hypothetical protein
VNIGRHCHALALTGKYVSIFTQRLITLRSNVAATCCASACQVQRERTRQAGREPAETSMSERRRRCGIALDGPRKSRERQGPPGPKNATHSGLLVGAVILICPMRWNDQFALLLQSTATFVEPADVWSGTDASSSQPFWPDCPLLSIVSVVTLKKPT